MIPRDRLVLGSAVFGMPWYGYHSTSRPTAQDSLATIRAAWRAGIRWYDVALGYGDALWLLQAAGVPASHIISKFRLPLSKATGLGAIGTWLVHNPTVADIDAGLIPATCGVSVYTTQEVGAARLAKIQPIQAPASCLNPAVNVEFGRAPFLQGVLLRDPSKAPPTLQGAVAAFQDIARAANVSPVALALHAAYGDRIVFGVSSVAQLREVLEASESFVREDTIKVARALASQVDATAALPSLWS